MAAVLLRRPQAPEPADGSTSAAEEARRRYSSSHVSTLVALTVFAALVVVTAVWGRWLIEQGHRLLLNAPPLAGYWAVRISARAAIPVAAGILAWAVVPRITERAEWRWVLLASFAVAGAFAVSLAVSDGPSGLLTSALSPADYLSGAHFVGSPSVFLSGFADRSAMFPVHVRSHPPGMVLLVWAIGRLGLRGPGPVAAIEILGGAGAVPAVLIALRDVAGEDLARRAAPFVALAPAAVFVASSGDALFAGLVAWAVALVVVATGDRSPRGLVFLGAAGGLLFGAALFFSYGLALLAVIPATVAASRRRMRPLVVGVATAGAIVLAIAVLGFRWVDAVEATRLAYARSVARTRPYPFFLVANVAAFSIALGPSIAVALARLRDRRAWLLVGAAVAAVAVADLSGMSKGEVERIWLPFAPWLLLAGCAFSGTRERRRWLALQIAAAIALQLALVSPW